MGLRAFWLICGLMVFSSEAYAHFTSVLTGTQEVPPNNSVALGNGNLELNQAEDSVTVWTDFYNLSGAPTMVHVHGPADPGATAPPILTLTQIPAATSGVLGPQVFAVTPAQAADLKAGRWYLNIHTPNFPNGEIRGRILRHQSQFTGYLSPDQEVPAVVNSPNARGFGSVTVHSTEDAVDIVLSFNGLGSAQTMSHIHGPALATGSAGVQIDVGVAPGAVTQGEIRVTRPITRVQLAMLRAGLTYFNVHSSTNGGGEIRAQIRPGMPVFGVIEGAQNVPGNATSGRGLFRIYLDHSQTMGFAEITVSNMAAPITSLALHGPAPAGAVGPVISSQTLTPTGQTGFRQVNIPFALSVTEVAGYYSGLLYAQINSDTPGARIRGQIDGILQDGLE